MTYVVVTGYIKESDKVHAVLLGDEYSVERDWGWVDTCTLAGNIVAYGLAPLNFSLDRSKKVVMDCGDFQRFSQKGSAVILAELKTRGGRTKGYKLLSCSTNQVVNLKTEDIVMRDEAYGDDHFIQNGIIRNKVVHCYPRKPFPVVTISASTAESNKKPRCVNIPVEPVRKTEPAKRIEMSEKQLNEVQLCKKNGISPKLISNPKLSPNQMRVLWVSKSKGALAEAFANPNLSEDVMKFYADRLYDKSTVEECREMLNHPELSTDELGELYLCVCDGIPYENYIGLSATEIATKREMERAEYWGSSKLFDADYYEKALNVAKKLHGF